MKAVRNHFFRYMIVAAIFCLVCIIYLGHLFYIQISGRENTYDSGTTTRTVTIQAVRGEIYDRNGKALVTNRYTYDLVLSYSNLATSGLRQSNEACLQLCEALKHTSEQEKHVEKFFPFEGTYPYYSFTEEIADADSIPYYRLQKVLKAIGLKADDGIEKIVKYYTSTYDLLATDNTGARLFDDDQIDTLIRLRYDMDAVGFKSAGEYTFAENVSLELMTYVKELNLTNISFTVNVERVYNYPGYASHILGTVGPIYSEEWEYYNEQGYQMNAIVGKSGCEYAFEEYLRGSDGTMKIEEDASGNVVGVTVLTAPVAGNDIYLTIDIDLQMAAEDGLKENVEYVVTKANGDTQKGSHCNAGSAVAIDPETFDVLVLASYPTYDLSSYNASYGTLLTAEGNPLFNRAINGLYAPGSTYKLGVSVAALTEGEITESSQINCSGTYTRYNSYQPKCSTYGYGSHMGNINVITAIAESCNCFFYELGYRLGIDTLNSYMSRFGFGQATGLEIGGSSGRLSGNAGNWLENEVAGLTLQAAIGQADSLASPMQLACYLATLSNGGTRYSAHLLKSVYAFGSDTPSYSYLQTEDTVLDSISISDDVLATVFDGMKEVIAGNEIIQRFITDSIPVTVGGKTGTAQNSTEADNALFVCAAPYNAPEIVISVVIEKGYTGGYASLTAGRILDAYYQKD